jgi:hypothetical protein
MRATYNHHSFVGARKTDGRSFQKRLRPAKGLKRLIGWKVRPSSTRLSRPKDDHKEVAMNAKLALFRPHVATAVAAATLSLLIAIGLFSGIIALFQRDGAPLERIVAEHACAHYEFAALECFRDSFLLLRAAADVDR